MKESPPLSQPLHVLVLSDSADCRAVVRAAFMLEPHLQSSITEVTDSATARKHAQAGTVHLVVLDSSLEDVRWFAEHAPDAAIVFLAFGDQSQDLQEVGSAGATDYFTEQEFGKDPAMLWISLRQTIRYHAVRLHQDRLTHTLRERDQQVVRLTQRLVKVIPTDERTGWLGYRQIIDRLAEEVGRSIRYQMPLSIALVGLREVKPRSELADILPEECWVPLADRFRATARRADVIGHYDATTLLVLLTNTPEEGAREFCHRLVSRFDEPISSQGGDIQICFDFGLREYRLEEMMSAAQLLAEAETRLQHSQGESERNYIGPPSL